MFSSCYQCSQCLSVHPSVCLSRGSNVRGAFVQPLPNYFGLLLIILHVQCMGQASFSALAYNMLSGNRCVSSYCRYLCKDMVGGLA